MRHLALLTLLCSTTLLGCAGSDEPATSAPSRSAAADATVEAVPIRARISGDQLAVENQSLSLLDGMQMTQLGLTERLQEAGFTVDPARHSVVLLSLGEQPTGGYEARITALQRKGDLLYVQGTAERPAADATTTQQVTYPFSAVVVDKLPSGLTLRSDITSRP